ncbi:MAG: PxxKW family cysteine-rich protein [Desulfobacterales bacterium]|nr:MAG: PxxKW family cysteine-rich protein [Desulfobacterales bacterium]
MNCTTIKQGIECPFMTGSGCSYKGGICHQIVEQCSGCKRTTQLTSGWYCTACPDPSVKWKNGNCNLASHVTLETAATKAKLNPLKASKRSKK